MKNLRNIRGLKQALLGAIVLALVLGPFQPLMAQAQEVPLPPARPAEFGGSTENQAAAAQAGATAPTSPGQPQQPTNTNAPECNWSSNWSLCITNVVYIFTVGIGSGFAYVAAYFFDLAVNLSLNGPAYALTFVSTGWTTARDLANMAFLFILIYIAFMIMLQAETSHTMSLLAGVIAVALLVNFSFFFTRVVIDAGNILSIQFYNSISAPSVQDVAQTSNVAAAVNAATGVGANTKDLTASIMGMLKLQNLFSTPSFKAFYDSQTGGSGFLVIVITLSFLYIAAAIMFYLLTVMFITAGVKFLVRIVVLWFLIIASPLAFVARAMPHGNKLRHYFDTWQDLLITHAFYPVAFMFIFLILTNFTNQMGNCVSTGGTSTPTCLIADIFSGLSAGASSGASPLATLAVAIANVAIRLGFVLVILYIGIKASDKISVMGADAAKSAGNWMGGKYTGLTKVGTRFAGSATFGGVGWAGRNTLGAGGNAVARSTTLRTREAKGGILGVGARALRGAGAATAGASFDVRAAPGVGKGLTDVLGTPQKGGYTKDYKDAVHAKEEKAKDLDANAGDKARAKAILEKEARGNTARGVQYKTHKDEHDNAKKELEKEERIVKELDAKKDKTVPEKEEEKRAKTSVKAYKAQMNLTAAKMKAMEKDISGEDKLKKQYAETLVSKRVGNMWGKVMRANREAADHIRHEKSKEKKLMDVVKEVTEENKEEAGHGEPAAEAAAHAETTPTAAPAPHTPAPANQNHPSSNDNHPS